MAFVITGFEHATGYTVRISSPSSFCGIPTDYEVGQVYLFYSLCMYADFVVLYSLSRHRPALPWRAMRPLTLSLLDVFTLYR